MMISPSLETKNTKALNFLSNIQFESQSKMKTTDPIPINSVKNSFENKKGSLETSPSTKSSFLSIPSSLEKELPLKNSVESDTSILTKKLKENSNDKRNLTIQTNFSSQRIDHSPKASKNQDALNFLSNIKLEQSIKQIPNNTFDPLKDKSPLKIDPNIKLRSSPIDVQKFEKSTLKEKSNENFLRSYFTKKSFPLFGSSFIKYNTKEDEGKKEKQKRVVDFSYEKILESPADDYDPNFLDDPFMGIGKKRKVVRLSGFLSSTIPFVRKEEVLEDLNQAFNEKHQEIAANISLSEIRDLKMKMFSSMCEGNTSVVELSTVAFGFIYLEKLITKGFVNKNNKMVTGAVCLLLAVKFNENKKNLNEFFDELEDSFGFTKKKVLEHEWNIFSEELEFNLVVDSQSLYPHLKQLVFLQGKTLEEYM